VVAAQTSAVPVLVQLLGSVNEALGLLVIGSLLIHAVTAVRLGANPALVRLLGSSDELVQSGATIALITVLGARGGCSEVRAAIVAQPGTVPALQLLLTSSNDAQLRSIAPGLLACLARAATDAPAAAVDAAAVDGSSGAGAASQPVHMLHVTCGGWFEEGALSKYIFSGKNSIDGPGKHHLRIFALSACSISSISSSADFLGGAGAACCCCCTCWCPPVELWVRCWLAPGCSR
jgi:hypothetical protein